MGDSGISPEVHNDPCKKVSPPVDHMPGKGLKGCQVCGLPSTAFCRNCGVAYYCCKEHQKQDWKLHKKSCYPVIMEQVPGEDGIRNLVATRDIPKNGMFLKEEPLVLFPHSSNDAQEVCIECCCIKGGDEEEVAATTFKCPHCGWKLCSSECQDGPNHSQHECPIFSKCGIKPEDITGDKYFLVGLIRTLLLEKTDEKRWNQLKFLNSYQPQRLERPEMKEMLDAYVRIIRDDCGLDRFDEDTIDFVFGALKGNSIDVSDYQSMISRNMTLLFPQVVQTGSTCIPNARFAVHHSLTGYIFVTLVATVAIPQGTNISTAFEQGLTSTFIRRSLKHRLFFRECKCERCADPTELGTYLGAIKCNSCKKGYHLQTEPTALTDCVWKCANCNHVIGEFDVSKVVHDASGMMQSAGEETSLEAVEKMLKCITFLKKEVLHPNNFIVINAEIDVCKRLLSLSGMFDITDKGRLLCEIGKHLLSVADVLAPGGSRLRGHILYYIQFGLINQLLRESRVRSQRKMKEGMQRFRKRQLEECKKHQEEVRQIFESEPEDSEEHFMLTTMKASTEVIPN